MTTLPIDYKRRPWRAKYLTEETPVLNAWMIFGERPGGGVDINDGQNDIILDVPREVAERIIVARNAFCKVIEEELGL